MKAKVFIGHHSDHLDEKMHDWLASEKVRKIHVSEMKMIADRENKLIVAVLVMYE